MPNTWLKHLLAVEKNIYAQAKVIKSLHKLKPEWLFIHITLETAPNEMWWDNQPHGYSKLILFPHSAKRVRECRQNHHDCMQNIPWLLWNALLNTPCISKHYKYMFLVARDLYKMFVFYRGNHTTRHSTVGIWSEVRVYRRPATNIPWAGGLYLGKFPDNRRLRC